MSILSFKQHPKFYQMVATAPWGDYGNCLIHGMRSFDTGLPNSFHFNRAGPYRIPVALPESGVLVVVAEVKEMLSRELRVAEFVPAILDTVVPLDWEHWDREDYAEIIPSTGEPEDYFREFAEHPSIFSEIDDLWVPRLSIGAVATNFYWDRDDIGPPLRERTLSNWKLELSSWNGHEMFLIDEGYGPIVTEAAKQHLERFAGEFIRFLPTRR